MTKTVNPSPILHCNINQKKNYQAIYLLAKGKSDSYNEAYQYL